MDLAALFIKDKVDTECISLGSRWSWDAMEMTEGGKSAKERPGGHQNPKIRGAQKMTFS